jgi:DNA-binding response OmpR family regulator
MERSRKHQICLMVVDDEPDLTWAISEGLQASGYRVLTAYSGQAALQTIKFHMPDLIILDIILPDISGIEVCATLRAMPETMCIPVIFLTARGTLQDRVHGLDSGADDYIVKPFEIAELEARVRALLRRSGYGAHAASVETIGNRGLVAGPFRLDPEHAVLWYEEQAISLTPTEFELMAFLIAHPGIVYASRVLLEKVWGYPPGTNDSSLVRGHVMNLRQKIEPDPSCPRFIRTLPGHGYAFEPEGTL